VVVVVDAQERLMPFIDGVTTITKNIRKVIRGSQIFDIPIVVTEQYPQGLGQTIAPITELLTELHPFSKLSFDCFECQPFSDHLEQLGRRTLALSGVEAHICIYQTALSALRRGFSVLLLEDAIGARNAEARAVGLHAAHTAGAQPCHSEMLLYSLERQAGTPTFRRLLNIVKEES
ncbi:MAG: isochorismatase family protein, partial [Chloroflexi bacterium]|nr:isochorismatase family protein [Chloroflexota bacterium]